MKAGTGEKKKSYAILASAAGIFLIALSLSSFFLVQIIGRMNLSANQNLLISSRVIRGGLNNEIVLDRKLLGTLAELLALEQEDAIGETLEKYADSTDFFRFSFVDVDIVIQEKEGRLLKEIIAQEGMEGFLAVENRINAGLDPVLSVIAPGGSVIYGREAMENLKRISEVVYLKMSFEEMERRIGNVVDRGVALKPGTTLRDLYEERISYFEKYADITVDEEGKNLGQVVDELRGLLEQRLGLLQGE